jgi:hypothetical protein
MGFWGAVLDTINSRPRPRYTFWHQPGPEQNGSGYPKMTFFFWVVKWWRTFSKKSIKRTWVFFYQVQEISIPLRSPAKLDPNPTFSWSPSFNQHWARLAHTLPISGAWKGGHWSIGCPQNPLALWLYWILLACSPMQMATLKGYMYYYISLNIYYTRPSIPQYQTHLGDDCRCGSGAVCWTLQLQP